MDKPKQNNSQKPEPKPVKDLLFDELAKVGEELCFGPHEPLILDDPNKFYWILEGAVEVFALPQGAEGQEGPASHLCRLKTRAFFAGLPEGFGQFSIVALAHAGTRVRALSKEECIQILQTNVCHLQATFGIDQWVNGLLQGMLRYVSVRPHSSQVLFSNKQEKVEANAVVASRKGVIWVYLPANSAMLMDTELVPAEEAVPVPLTPESWLKISSDCEVSTQSTLKLIAAGDAFQALTAFHEAFVNSLPFILNLAKVDEVNRQRLKDQRETAELRRVVSDLAALIEGKKEDAVGSDSSQYLFSAIDVVLRSMGNKARAPVKVRMADVDVAPSLEEITRASGVRSRDIHLQDDWWRSDMGPMLGYLAKDKQPVALIPNGRKGYRAFDPITAKWRVLNAKLAADYAAEAVVFFNPLPDQPLSLKDLLGFGLSRNGGEIGMILLASIAGSLIGLAVPSATAYIINSVIPGYQPELLYQLGIALAVLAVVTGLFHVVNEISLNRLTMRTGSWLKAALWDRLLRMPLNFVSNFAAGDLASRITAMEGMQAVILMAAKTGAWSAALMTSSLAVLVYLEWRAAMVALAMVTLLLLVTFFFGYLQYRAFKNGEMAAGLVQSFLLELTTGIAKVRLAGAEERAFVNWADRFTKLRSRLIAVRRVMNAHTGFMAGYNILSLAGVFGVIALINQGEPMTTGVFMAFVSAYTGAVGAAMTLASAIMMAAFQVPILKYVEPVMKAVPSEQGGRTDPGTLSGRIEVNNVAFRYKGDQPPVLAGVSMKIEPGEFVAIVGSSGCGKSTLVKLLLGLERPQNGAIFYDERDLRGLDIAAVRRQVGTVLQQARLMPGSLYENIRGTTDADHDAAWEAAKMAGIDQDIREMPMGMETLVTEAARGFSGGQVQRIAIARAIVHRPPVVIFDEATSALDNHAQALVTESLERMSATRIVIAHRLSTIRNADRIIVMSSGKVVEQGNYEQLMRKGGAFARLAARQLA